MKLAYIMREYRLHLKEPVLVMHYSTKDEIADRLIGAFASRLPLRRSSRSDNGGVKNEIQLLYDSGRDAKLEPSFRKALRAGMTVVMDRCIYRDYVAYCR